VPPRSTSPESRRPHAPPPLSLLGATILAGTATVAGGTILAAGPFSAAAALRVQALGMALAGLAGGACAISGETAGEGFSSELAPAVGVDPLSGLFLAIVALAAVPAAVYATASLRGAVHARALAALTGLFQLALVGVLAARDVTLFLAFWELMTVVPAAAILVARPEAPARRTVFEYLAITHVAGAGVWVAMLVLADRGALGDPAGLAPAGAGVQALVAVAGLIGFGTKAGLVPLHSWLPRAHPLAPSFISAVMSGVMVKVALYGLVRLLFEWLGGPPLWVGLTVLGLGAVSALAGILYALLQPDLKRLLAFSTVENAGIVALALGAAAVLLARGEDLWAAVAFAGALLHAVNHAAAKALAFLGAGSIERAAGGLRLDRMGGLLRRMPWTGSAFLVGALALAGVPVLGLFASEWLTLQALLGLAREDALGIAMAAGVATAVLGATVGLGALCFAKVIGLVLLGRPRTPACAAAGEVARPMRTAVLALAAACLALGLVPGLLVPTLAELAPGGATPQRGLDVAAVGTSLPTLGLALTLAVAAALAVALRGGRTSAPGEVWACGQAVEAPLAWTSAAFGKPVRLSLGRLLRPERSVEAVVRNGVVQGIRHRADVPHLFDTLLYAPVLRSALAGASAARRLQSGSLRLYVASLVGLVLLLLLLARLGALG
jgi:formate hydrogenlyase subunit 3/multisubunit Na+/H+ antiporter MnhD subunit